MVTKDTVALANTHGANGSAQSSAFATERSAPSGAFATERSAPSGAFATERSAPSGTGVMVAASTETGVRLHTAAAVTEPTDKKAETTKGVASGKAANCANRPENSGPSAKPEVSTT